jgi:phage shock protein A
MNRDYPLAPTFFGGKQKRIERIQKKEDRLVSRGNKAVDEGRDKKADRLLGRAAKVEDKKIRLSENKK